MTGLANKHGCALRRFRGITCSGCRGFATLIYIAVKRRKVWGRYQPVSVDWEERARLSKWDRRTTRRCKRWRAWDSLRHMAFWYRDFIRTELCVFPGLAYRTMVSANDVTFKSAFYTSPGARNAVIIIMLGCNDYHLGNARFSTTSPKSYMSGDNEQNRWQNQIG